MNRENAQAKVSRALSPSAWKAMKKIKPAAPRYIHVSCEAAMIPDPRSLVAGVELPFIPYVQKPGRTFDDGRNAAKRADRRADIRARAEARRAR